MQKFISLTVFTICFFQPFQLNAQELLDVAADTLFPKNSLTVGAQKIAGTYLFSGLAGAELNLLFGKVSISQYYTGVAITSWNSFRDDETFVLAYEIPVSKNFSLCARQNWIYSSDTRQIGLNELERINGSAGIKYSHREYGFFEIFAGAESNKQVGVRSPGTIAAFTGELNALDFDGYIFETKAKGEFLKLNYDRTNSNLDWSAKLTKSYDAVNAFDARIYYKNLNRDFLSSQIPGAEEQYSVESRLENRIRSDLFFNVGIFDNLSGRLNLAFENNRASRSYNEQIPQILKSGITRTLTKTDLSLDASALYKLDNFSQQSGIAFAYYSEETSVEKKFSLTEEEFNRLRNIEKRFDNHSSIRSLFTKTLWQPFASDSVRLNYFVYIRQYDSPSDDINDDYDYFRSLLAFGWSHRFSTRFTVALDIESDLRHMVYIKAERSALNHWTRILKFSPRASIDAGWFKTTPHFYILANYTNYDFQTAQSDRNRSFREIGYSDSLIVFLEKNISLQSSIIVRYSERGILYWNEFAETPQNSNFEQFTKLMLVLQPMESLMLAIGGRYYNLSERSLYNKTKATVDFTATGPETVITARFPSGTTVSVSGWYEFQFSASKLVNKLPNFFIHANFNL